MRHHFFLPLLLLLLSVPARGESPPTDLEGAIDYLADELMFQATEVIDGTLDAALYPFAESFSGADRIESKETVLARAIQGQVAEALAERRRIRVLDRDFQTVFKELKLQESTKFDKSTIVTFGNFIGAEGVITGEILDLVRQVQVTVKVISTKTSATIASASVLIDARQIACKLLRECAQGRADSDDGGGGDAAAQKLAVRGVDVTLQGCARAGSTITCRLVLQHHVQGRMDLGIWGHETTITYPDGLVAVATGMVLGTSRSSGRVVYQLSPETPVALTLDFAELPRIPPTIHTLHLELAQRDFEFKNIAVQ